MLPAERVLCAFEHREYDCVPIYVAGLSSRVASAVLGREAYVGGGIQQYREACALWEGEEAHREFLERSLRDALELIRVLDLDVVRSAYWRMPQRPTKRLDERTFLYGDPEGAWRIMRFDPETELYQVVARSPEAEPTLEELEREARRARETAEAYRPRPEDFPDLNAALAEFGGERAVPGRGAGLCIPRQEAWLAAIALRPEVVHMLLEAQIVRARKNIRVMAEMGLRFIQGGGDFASKAGPFYSPQAFSALMLPRLKEISAECKRQGCFHMFASDGNLWPVAQELFGESGVDCYYEIDGRAGMDLAQLRRRFPHLTLMGGISSETLHLGTREDVVRETRAALRAAKEYGSIIVGCSNQVVAMTPVENFQTMIDVLHNERAL